jgi:hypothetical protein
MAGTLVAGCDWSITLALHWIEILKQEAERFVLSGDLRNQQLNGTARQSSAR